MIDYLKLHQYNYEILHRGDCRCVGYYATDSVFAGDECRLCEEPFGFNVPIIMDDGERLYHLSCAIERQLQRARDAQARALFSRIVDAFGQPRPPENEEWEKEEGKLLDPSPVESLELQYLREVWAAARSVASLFRRNPHSSVTRLNELMADPRSVGLWLRHTEALRIHFSGESDAPDILRGLLEAGGRSSEQVDNDRARAQSQGPQPPPQQSIDQELGDGVRVRHLDGQTEEKDLAIPDDPDAVLVMSGKAVGGSNPEMTGAFLSVEVTVSMRKEKLLAGLTGLELAQVKQFGAEQFSEAIDKTWAHFERGMSELLKEGN